MIALRTVHHRTSFIFLDFGLAIRTQMDLNLVQIFIKEVGITFLFRVRFRPTLYASLPQTTFAFYKFIFLLDYFATCWVAAEHQSFVLNYSQIILKPQILEVNIFTYKLF